jgi:hypothetical protein
VLFEVCWVRVRSGEVKRKALRKSAVDALMATGLGIGCKPAVQALVDAAIERGSQKGKWSVSDEGVVSRSKKRKE